MKIIYLFLIILLLEKSNELRIFNGVVDFFKTIFFKANDLNIDGYVLSLQWIRKCFNYYSIYLISPFTANRFSIHGLWPQSNLSPMMYCLNEKFDPFLLQPLLVEKLNYHWPSLRNSDRNNIRFLAHEYEKHGTCFPFEGDLKSRINNYFSKAINIFESLFSNNYLNELENNSISLYDFLRLYRIEAKIICKRIGNIYYVKEIRFYLDNLFRFVPYLSTSRACRRAVLNQFQ